MSDVITREGWLAGSRSRKLDVNKKPIEEWSQWRWQSANGSGYFSYLYSAPGKCGFNKDELERVSVSPIYDDTGEWSYKNTPKRVAFDDYTEWRKAYYNWSNSKPIIGYNERQYKCVAGKIVVDEKDLV